MSKKLRKKIDLSKFSAGTERTKFNFDKWDKLLQFGEEEKDIKF